MIYTHANISLKRSYVYLDRFGAVYHLGHKLGKYVLYKLYKLWKVLEVSLAGLTKRLKWQ